MVIEVRSTPVISKAPVPMGRWPKACQSEPTSRQRVGLTIRMLATISGKNEVGVVV